MTAIRVRPVLTRLALASLTSGLFVVPVAFAQAASAQATVTCPTVGPSGQVTPAPQNGVNWSGCDLNSANLANAPLQGADLADASLQGANLGNADLADADLSESELRISVLTGANVAGTNLEAADLTLAQSGGLTGTPAELPDNWHVISGYLIGPLADLLKADLTGADLSHVDLTQADLIEATLTGTNLSGANLSDARITDAAIGSADFSGANLAEIISGGVTGLPASLPAHWQPVNGYLIGPGANVQDASLPGLSLPKADLSGVNFRGADLTGADFAGANLAGAQLDLATLTNADFTGATLTTANLAGGLLSGADLHGADLHLGSLHQADLFAADLSEANLSSTDISRANFSNKLVLRIADLSGANLAHADLFLSNLSPLDAKLTGVKWSDTGCPNGTNSSQFIDGCFSKPRQNPLVVTVQGVTSRGMYVIDGFKVSCQTTDALEKVTAPARLKITGGAHGVGETTATCAGAVDAAGDTSKPVSVSYTVVYGFGGFSAPKRGVAIGLKTHRFTAAFRLVTGSGAPAISGHLADELAKAGDVKVRLTGPRIQTTTVRCRWKPASNRFSCTVPIPAGAEAGKSGYRLTALENPGLPGLVKVPRVDGSNNPQSLTFR